MQYLREGRIKKIYVSSNITSIQRLSVSLFDNSLYEQKVIPTHLVIAKLREKSLLNSVSLKPRHSLIHDRRFEYLI